MKQQIEKKLSILFTNLSEQIQNKSRFRKNTMNLFMANKQLGFGVNLEELKRMTPQEAYLFMQQVAEALRKFEYNH